MAALGHCGVCYVDCEKGQGGLESEGQLWLPLLSLSAHASVCHSFSRVNLKQTFSAPTSKGIDEAAYRFPLYEGASIVAFTCKIGERTIRGVVQEKDTARRAYEAAKDRGESAGLLVQNTPDVWSTRIGNISAGKNVEVEIEYVCELKHDAQVDGIRFVLPTQIAPRYGQAPDNIAPPVASESRGIDITVSVTMTSPITSMQSPSHPIAVGMGTHSIDRTQTLSKEDLDVCKAQATLSQASTALDKDFVVMVVAAQVGQPQAIVETHPTIPHQKALMLTLVPKFRMPQIKPEIVFVADRSGSMVDKVSALRNALTVFLKSLPVGVKFNICSFGSHHTFLWPKSMVYNQENLDTALHHVQTFDANYGGTEMFPPIEATLKQRYKDLPTEILVLTDGEIWNTEALFDMVRRECQSGDVRVFSLGIGDSVSHFLLEGLARAGKGYAQFVLGNDGLDAKVVRMLKAALGMHIRDYELLFHDSPAASTTTTPATEDEDEGDEFEIVEHDRTGGVVEGEEQQQQQAPRVHVDEKMKTISLFDPSADPDRSPQSLESPQDRFSHLPPFTPPAKLQTPYNIPPLYPFTRATVYILLSSASQKIPKYITLRGTAICGQHLEQEIPVTAVGTGTTLHQLAAKKLMQELEEGSSYLHSGKFGIDPVKDEGRFGDWIEREAVRVGTTFGVAGKWTSFVAVESHSGKERVLLRQGDDEGSDESVPEVRLLSAPGAATFSSSGWTAGPSLRGGAPASFTAATMFAGPPNAAMATSYLSACTVSASGGGSSPFAGLFRKSKRDASVERKKNVQQISPRIHSVAHSSPFSRVVESVQKSKHESVEERKAAATPEDITHRLIGLQAFDGSFSRRTGAWAERLLDEFAKWVEGDAEMAPLRSVDRGETEKLVASAIAVAVFESDLKSTKEVWDMVVEKTDGWGTALAGDRQWALIRNWAAGQVSVADDNAKQSFF